MEKYNCDKIYECVYANIDSIIEKYDYVLNPTNNKLTKEYLTNSNDIKHSYALSFTTMLVLYLQINN